MRYSIAALGLLLLIVIGGACSGSNDNGDGNDPDSVSPPGAMGPGISVEEAWASTLDGVLLVNGFLVVRDGEAKLCSVLAESFPPQCGGDSLRVAGLDLEDLDGLQNSQGVTWSDREIQLLGNVADGVLTVGGGKSG